MLTLLLLVLILDSVHFLLVFICLLVTNRFVFLVKKWTSLKYMQNRILIFDCEPSNDQKTKRKE